ncbi:adenylate/guanylate cyclase domain-containing protein [Benzoatithermus flavus]|uniref:Adenylate/guanylate cyclase domain-containing protein n=1 Tax=Benzoatithermus flavus TaxID=3108223 RepID=A0ABU8XP43_9PROT
MAAKDRAERRLAAILAADVVGYSRLIEADEAATLALIKSLRREVIDPLLAEHHGRIVKLMGDGALVEFASVVDAVACAVAVQRAVAGRQAAVPAERRIVFRIGVNLGDVVVEGEDLLGDGVNVAARLEQLCEPGGVLVSGTAYDHLQGRLGLPLTFAGEQRVKNIARPIRTYRVELDGKAARRRSWWQGRRAAAALAALLVLAAAAAGGWWWGRAGGDAGAQGRASIAVLPFENLGGDAATGRLADGLTEDTITDLARFRDLDVIARNSTAAYKGKPVDVREVGRALGVRYVLEGSIQRQGARVRVTAQLIDAPTGTHVWSERWDRPTQDVFAVQSELAEAVAAKIGGYTGLIVAADRDLAKRKRPQDLNAYDLYLLGIEAKHRETKESVEEAIRLLKQSLAIDPNFARAWTGLSWSYQVLGGFVDETPELRQAAKDAAQQAVDLDPMDAEAHAALASALGREGNLVRTGAELGKALDLNPNSADILTFYADWASSFGQAERGAAAAEQAIRLNPNMPNWALSSYRYAFFMVGRYEDALRMLDRKPRDNYRRSDYVFRAAALGALGRVEEAHAAVAEALTRFPNLTVEGFAGAPEWSAAERQRLTDTMRRAGFPACAKQETLKIMPGLERLPECASS